MQWMYPDAASRVARHLPHAKLIYLVRNPLERIRSHWMDYASQNPPPRELGEFNRTVRDWPHLVDVSRYWLQLSKYRQYYADDQILVLFFEDLVASPQDTMTRSFRFLGVDASFRPEAAAARQNASSGRFTDRAFYRNIRKWPGANRVADYIPSGVKTVSRRLLKTHHAGKPVFNAITLESTKNQLREDTQKLLEYSGKPDEFWAEGVS